MIVLEKAPDGRVESEFKYLADLVIRFSEASDDLFLPVNQYSSFICCLFFSEQTCVPFHSFK